MNLCELCRIHWVAIHFSLAVTRTRDLKEVPQLRGVRQIMLATSNAKNLA